MDASTEESNMERSDKEEITPEHIRKRLLLKVQRIKLRKSMNRKHSYGPSALNISAIYELKLKKLQKNNKCLAKALAEQRMESQQYLNEVLLLKGQLQEAQERLLRSNDKSTERIIDDEVGRRIKEIGEPLNQAVSQAMENLLIVVENFSKVKQLANTRATSTRSSSSSFSFPRSSGARAPLGSSGSGTTSPCQSVRPMVSGHVLQPAMVAIQKLYDVWHARMNERSQARQDIIDLSVVGENSGASGDEEEITSNPSQDESITNFELSHTDPSINVSEESVSLSPRSPRRRSYGRRGRIRNSSRGSRTPSPSKSPAVAVSPQMPVVDVEQRATSPEIGNEDPLEGPSWWYGDTSTGRGKGRGRSRGRGRKRGRPRSIQTFSPTVYADTSSEDDEIQTKKTRYQSSGTKSANVSLEDIKTLASSPAQSLERSYLESPRSMLTKLENLEARAGRRSKSKSKGRSLRISGINTDNAHSHLKPRASTVTKDKKCSSRDSQSLRLEISDLSANNSVHNVDDDFVSNTATTDTADDDNPLPIELPPIRPQNNFLITDNDLTCIADISMDMTEPISKILSQAAAATESKKNESNKKFFKKNGPNQLQASDDSVRTPFDLSLMEATYVNIPPYASQKSNEKENMPPPSNDSDNITSDKTEGTGDVNLRRVSIILKDFMKSTETIDKSPTIATSQHEYESNVKTDETEETQSKRIPKQGKGAKKSINNKETLHISFYKGCKEENEELEESWSPVSKNKRNSTNKKGRPSTVRKKRSSIVDHSSETTKRPRGRSSKRASSNPVLTDSDIVPKENVDEEPKENNATVNSVLDDFENFDLKLGFSDCFVKLCRTPTKEDSRNKTPSEGSEPQNNYPDFGLVCRRLNEPTVVENLSSPLNSSSIEPVNTQHEKESVQTDTPNLTLQSQGRCTLDQVQEELSGDVEENLTDPVQMSEHVQEEMSDQVVPDAKEAHSPIKDVEENTSDSTIDAVKGRVIPITNVLPTLIENKLGPVAEQMAVGDDVDGQPRRRRGAALKISSFKEPSLNSKMRQDRNSTGGSKPKTDRRSGRKLSSS